MKKNMIFFDSVLFSLIQSYIIQNMKSCGKKNGGNPSQAQERHSVRQSPRLCAPDPGRNPASGFMEQEDGIMTENKMEKLRKMKADNVLALETLDQASGGNGGETAQDSKFLYKLLEGHEKQPQRLDYVSGRDNDDAINQVVDAWTVVGVKMVPGKKDHNQYFIGDKRVSQVAAYIHAQKITGRFLDQKDVDWSNP